MSYVQALKSAIRSPSILCTKKHVFLLSHMRANTSLVGHVLGSHPQINGYYEMHIGYYSERSLLRQKMLYCQHHSLKKHSNYMFDKLLHNEHHISDIILEHPNTLLIMGIRAPEYTIPSIVSLYKKAHPEHEFTQPQKAAAYYCQRLNLLAKIALMGTVTYLYFDADAVKVTPSSTLNTLSKFLELQTPLSPQYEKMRNTGKAKAGDSSSSLMKGEIIQSQLTSTNLPYQRSEFFKECEKTYQNVRSILIANAKESVIL